MTGTNGEHPDGKVEHELRHLREMKIDFHRPLTLRLLSDVERVEATVNVNEALARVVGGIGAWITRCWLADSRMAGANATAADFAHAAGPREGEDFATYWLGLISNLKNSSVRVAVPNDEVVREGILNRQAYGGGATPPAFAILCAMMEQEHREEAPKRDRLTIEHVMPRKLGDQWERSLGEGAKDIHGRWRHRLANLTLSGDDTNSSLGAQGFEEKKRIYRNSPIGMTRRIAEESEWNEQTLERRSQALADKALQLWPWEEAGQAASQAPIRWRIDEGEWQFEQKARQMLKNVAATLLSRDPSNGEKLSGTTTKDLILAGSPAANAIGKKGEWDFVPGHEKYLVYEKISTNGSKRRCQEMGQRCNVKVEVDLIESNQARKFWEFLNDRAGGVPGQRKTWSQWRVWTQPQNAANDQIGIEIADGTCWIWVWDGTQQNMERRSARMQSLSWRLQERMSDQEFSDDVERKGSSVSVQLRSAAVEDESAWPDIALWIKDQTERVSAIIADLSEQLPVESQQSHP